MKKTALVCAAVVLMPAALGGMTVAEDETTLRGEYDWGGRKTGELEAVFTPTGEGTWDVSFHFDFRNEPHVFSGTAQGNLADGKLEGRVFNDNKKRTFTFAGEFTDGTFTGTHAEIEGERVQDTGTMTLS